MGGSRKAALGLVLLGLCCTASGSGQGISASATAHVRVLVNPNIAIAAIIPSLDLGTVQTGDVVGSIDFQIDANTEEVCICVAASDLYKGDDPTNADAPVIPINLTAGVVIQPEHANPVDGLSNVASYISDPGPVMEGFPTHWADHFRWESSQNNHFSQKVNVKVTWTQTDAELPTGEYAGVVCLFAMAIPPGD